MVMKEKMQMTAAMVVALCALYAVSPPLEWPPTSLAIRVDFEQASDAINNDVNKDAVNEDAVNQQNEERSPNLLAGCCQSHLPKLDCCQETVAKLNNVVAKVVEPLKQELQAEVVKALSKENLLGLEEKLFQAQAVKVYHTYNRADFWASGLAWSLDGDHTRSAIFKESNKAAEFAEKKKVAASKPDAPADDVAAAEKAAATAVGTEKAAKAKADAGTVGQKGGDILCNYIFNQRQYSNSTSKALEEGCVKESIIVAKLKGRTFEERMRATMADFPLAYFESPGIGFGEFVPESSSAAISFRQLWNYMPEETRQSQFGKFMEEGKIPLDKIPNFLHFQRLNDRNSGFHMTEEDRKIEIMGPIKATLVGRNLAAYDVLNQEEWIKLGTALSPILSSFTFRAMDEVDKLIDSGCMQHYYESNTADCAGNE